MYPHHLAGAGMPQMGHMAAMMGPPSVHPRMHMLARGPQQMPGMLAQPAGQMNLVPTPVRPRAHFRPSPGSSASMPAMVCVHCGTLVQSNHSHQLKRHLGTCRYLPAPVRQLLDAAARERAARMEGVYGNNAVYRKFQVVGWLRSVCNACGMEVRGDSSKLGRHLGMCKADKSRDKARTRSGSVKSSSPVSTRRSTEAGSSSGPAPTGGRKRGLTIADSRGYDRRSAVVATGGGAPESPAIDDGRASARPSYAFGRADTGDADGSHHDDDGSSHDGGADNAQSPAKQASPGAAGDGDAASTAAPAHAQSSDNDAAAGPGPSKRRRLRQRPTSTARHGRDTRKPASSVSSANVDSDEEQGRSDTKPGAGVRFELNPAQHFSKSKCRYCGHQVASSQPNHLKRHLGNCRKVPPRVVRDLDADAVLHARGSAAEAALFNVVGFMSSVCRVCGCMVRGDTYKVRKHRAKCTPPTDDASAAALMPSTSAAPMLVVTAPATAPGAAASGGTPRATAAHAATPPDVARPNVRRTSRRIGAKSPVQRASGGESPSAAAGASAPGEPDSEGTPRTRARTSRGRRSRVKQEADDAVPSSSEHDAVAMLVGRFAPNRSTGKDSQHPGAATPAGPEVAGAPGHQPDALRTYGGDSAGRNAAQREPTGSARDPRDWSNAPAHANGPYGWSQGAPGFGPQGYSGDGAWAPHGMAGYGPEYAMQQWPMSGGMRQSDGQVYAASHGTPHGQEAMMMRVQHQMWAARERMAYQMRHNQQYAGSGGAPMYYAQGMPSDGAPNARGGYGPPSAAGAPAVSHGPDGTVRDVAASGPGRGRAVSADAAQAAPQHRPHAAQHAARAAFAAAAHRQASAGPADASHSGTAQRGAW